MLTAGLSYLVISNKIPTFNQAGTAILELVWTVVPAIVLLSLAFPSIRILYMIDARIPYLTFKRIGHQWYWRYETPSEFFDSYINSRTYRLLDVDNNLFLPIKKNIRALITRSDVLHCWAIPSLGVKADAVPGRLNQVNFNILRPSVLYGQCSEICGANHRFMPICLESLPNFRYVIEWL